MALIQMRSELKGPILVAWLDGELDLASSTGLTAELAALVPNTVMGLVLDLSGLTYLDSAGVGMIFSLSRQLRARQQTLGIVVPETARIRRVLAVASVATAAQIFPDLPSALRAPV
jgi:anti-anti-sigma factor